METFWWILGGSLIGGFVAGSVALMLGGVGGQIKLGRQISTMGDLFTELHGKVEREIKARASSARWSKPDPADALVDELAKAATAHVARPTTPADVLASAKRAGLVR